MKFEISRFSKEYLEQVSELLSEMWLMHAEKSNLVSQNKLIEISAKDYLKDIFDKDKQTGFIALMDKEVVGFVKCEIKKCPEFFIHDKEVFVDDLIVKKEYRENGIATKLINECVLFAKENCIKLLTGKVWKFNKEARSFLDKMEMQEDYGFFSREV